MLPLEIPFEGAKNKRTRGKVLLFILVLLCSNLSAAIAEGEGPIRLGGGESSPWYVLRFNISHVNSTSSLPLLLRRGDLFKVKIEVLLERKPTKHSASASSPRSKKDDVDKRETSPLRSSSSTFHHEKSPADGELMLWISAGYILPNSPRLIVKDSTEYRSAVLQQADSSSFMQRSQDVTSMLMSTKEQKERAENKGGSSAKHERSLFQVKRARLYSTPEKARRSCFLFHDKEEEEEEEGNLAMTKFVFLSTLLKKLPAEVNRKGQQKVKEVKQKDRKDATRRTDTSIVLSLSDLASLPSTSTSAVFNEEDVSKKKRKSTTVMAERLKEMKTLSEKRLIRFQFSVLYCGGGDVIGVPSHHDDPTGRGERNWNMFAKIVKRGERKRKEEEEEEGPQKPQERRKDPQRKTFGSKKKGGVFDDEMSTTPPPSIDDDTSPLSTKWWEKQFSLQEEGLQKKKTTTSSNPTFGFIQRVQIPIFGILTSDGVAPTERVGPREPLLLKKNKVPHPCIPLIHSFHPSLNTVSFGREVTLRGKHFRCMPRRLFLGPYVIDVPHRDSEEIKRIQQEEVRGTLCTDEKKRNGDVQQKNDKKMKNNDDDEKVVVRGSDFDEFKLLLPRVSIASSMRLRDCHQISPHEISTLLAMVQTTKENAEFAQFFLGDSSTSSPMILQRLQEVWCTAVPNGWPPQAFQISFSYFYDGVLPDFSMGYFLSRYTDYLKKPPKEGEKEKNQKVVATALSGGPPFLLARHPALIATNHPNLHGLNFTFDNLQQFLEERNMPPTLLSATAPPIATPKNPPVLAKPIFWGNKASVLIHIPDRGPFIYAKEEWQLLVSSSAPSIVKITKVVYESIIPVPAATGDYAEFLIYRYRVHLRVGNNLSSHSLSHEEKDEVGTSSSSTQPPAGLLVVDAHDNEKTKKNFFVRLSLRVPLLEYFQEWGNAFYVELVSPTLRATVWTKGHYRYKLRLTVDSLDATEKDDDIVNEARKDKRETLERKSAAKRHRLPSPSSLLVAKDVTLRVFLPQTVIILKWLSIDPFCRIIEKESSERVVGGGAPVLEAAAAAANTNIYSSELRCTTKHLLSESHYDDDQEGRKKDRSPPLFEIRPLLDIPEYFQDTLNITMMVTASNVQHDGGGAMTSWFLLRSTDAGVGHVTNPNAGKQGKLEDDDDDDDHGWKKTELFASTSPDSDRPQKPRTTTAPIHQEEGDVTASPSWSEGLLEEDCSLHTADDSSIAREAEDDDFGAAPRQRCHQSEENAEDREEGNTPEEGGKSISTTDHFKEEYPKKHKGRGEGEDFSNSPALPSQSTMKTKKEGTRKKSQNEDSNAEDEQTKNAKGEKTTTTAFHRLLHQVMATPHQKQFCLIFFYMICVYASAVLISFMLHPSYVTDSQLYRSLIGFLSLRRGQHRQSAAHHKVVYHSKGKMYLPSDFEKEGKEERQKRNMQHIASSEPEKEEETEINEEKERRNQRMLRSFICSHHVCLSALFPCNTYCAALHILQFFALLFMVAGNVVILSVGIDATQQNENEEFPPFVAILSWFMNANTISFFHLLPPWFICSFLLAMWAKFLLFASRCESLQSMRQSCLVSLFYILLPVVSICLTWRKETEVTRASRRSRSGFAQDLFSWHSTPEVEDWKLAFSFIVLLEVLVVEVGWMLGIVVMKWRDVKNIGSTIELHPHRNIPQTDCASTVVSSHQGGKRGVSASLSKKVMSTGSSVYGTLRMLLFRQCCVHYAFCEENTE